MTNYLIFVGHFRQSEATAALPFGTPTASPGIGINKARILKPLDRLFCAPGRKVRP